MTSVDVPENNIHHLLDTILLQQCSLSLHKIFIKFCHVDFNSYNPLPNDKILDLSKLKTFADNKINVTQKLKFALGRVKNSVGKG